MASISLLGSATWSFHGQFPVVSSPPTVRFLVGNLRTGSGAAAGRATAAVKETAAGAVLVEKSESEKVNRLKATYLEKIVPLLMEEFSYTNDLEVSFPILCSLLEMD